MKLSKLAKNMIISIIILGVISIIASIIYHRSFNFLPFMFGVFIGSCVSIIKVLLLERAIEKVLTMDKKQATNYVSFQHLLRLFLTGAVLFLGAIIPHISLWGVAAGVMAFQISVYVVKLITKD